MAMAPLDRKLDPLQWWKMSGLEELKRTARTYLTPPVSSIFSEQVFSEGGNLYEQKRNRLLPRNAEKLLFLHHNMPLVGCTEDEFKEQLQKGGGVDAE